MKVGIRIEELYQPKPFTSKRVGIELAEVDTTNPEETVRELFKRAKLLVQEEKGDSNGKGKHI